MFSRYVLYRLDWQQFTQATRLSLACSSASTICNRH